MPVIALSRTEVQGFASRVESFIREEYEQNWHDYVTERGIRLDFDNVMEQNVEKVMELEGIPLDKEDALVDAVRELLPKTLQRQIKSDIEEKLQDQLFWQQGPLAYFGMSERDFM